MSKESDKILPASVKMDNGSTASPLLTSLLDKAGIVGDIQQKWDEIDGIYTEIAQGIYQIGVEVNGAIRLINSLGIHKDVELATSVRGMTRDIEEFSQGLLKIKGRHEGMSGRVKDSEELALLLSVFEDYTALNNRFRAVVFPVMLTVTERLAQAQSMTGAEEQKMKNLQDPNVVSDVQVKEATQ